METDAHRQHLEFIQQVITRMNANSFKIKGWTVTLVSALLAVCASTKDETFVLTALFPAIVMWFLDAYYLMQERKFRGLYGDVAGYTSHHPDIAPYAMRPDLYSGGRFSYFSALLSRTIGTLYIVICLGLVLLYVWLVYSGVWH